MASVQNELVDLEQKAGATAWGVGERLGYAWPLLELCSEERRKWGACRYPHIHLPHAAPVFVEKGGFRISPPGEGPVPWTPTRVLGPHAGGSGHLHHGGAGGTDLALPGQRCRSAQPHSCRRPPRCSDTTGRGARGSGDARARGGTWAGERPRGARGAAPAAPPQSPALFPGEALSAGCAGAFPTAWPLPACLRTRVCPAACARALGVGCSSRGQSRVRNTAHCWQVPMRLAEGREPAPGLRQRSRRRSRQRWGEGAGEALSMLGDSR
nr:uncharacterized protein LOC115494570 [Taeniopygia guttata]